MREEPAEEFGIPGSCNGLEGEGGAGNGDEDWAFWFEGGLGLWGGAGVGEEVVDMVSDFSGEVEERFLGRIREARCRW